MVFVALLRGINVGGKNRVEMNRLKELFIQLGFNNVQTYINSGNIIFDDKRQITKLNQYISVVIEKEFGFCVPIVLRSSSQIKLLYESVPSEWSNDMRQKTDVMFLWEEIDSPDILEKIVYKPDIENVLYLPGALVWNIGRENISKGSGIKLIKTDLYKHMTARNINTVRKLNELCSQRTS